MQRKLRRDIRLLKVYAVGSTLLFGFFVLTGFRQASAQRTKFEQIDVERINIVERDGRLKLVIANSERQTPAMMDGRELLPGRSRPAGIIFFNDIGDEVGGLIFTGRLNNGVPGATGSLTFDQFKQDQTVALQYVDQNGRRRAGLEVIDRPQTSLAVYADLIQKGAAAATAAERAEIERQITALGPTGNQRMFAGRDVEGRATLVLSDTQGRARLRLAVGPDGIPRIQLLNADGTTAREIVP
jgi:hypothetical protein